MSQRPIRYTLGREKRLVRQGDFNRVYGARCSVADEHLVCYAAANETGHPRLGLSVSRKLGNSPRRNRFKRLLREAFRHIQHDLPQGFDFVLIPRSGPPATVEQYRESIARLAERAARKFARRAAEATAAPDAAGPTGEPSNTGNADAAPEAC